MELTESRLNDENKCRTHSELSASGEVYDTNRTEKNRKSQGRTQARSPFVLLTAVCVAQEGVITGTTQKEQKKSANTTEWRRLRVSSICAANMPAGTQSGIIADRAALGDMVGHVAGGGKPLLASPAAGCGRMLSCC